METTEVEGPLILRCSLVACMTQWGWLMSVGEGGRQAGFCFRRGMLFVRDTEGILGIEVGAAAQGPWTLWSLCSQCADTWILGYVAVTKTKSVVMCQEVLRHQQRQEQDVEMSVRHM